jgi:hypothetical protein
VDEIDFLLHRRQNIWHGNKIQIKGFEEVSGEREKVEGEEDFEAASRRQKKQRSGLPGKARPSGELAFPSAEWADCFAGQGAAV